MSDKSTGAHSGNGKGDPAEELAIVLSAAASGDQNAWRTLVHTYSRRVYAMARSRLGPVGGPRSGNSHRSGAQGSAARGSGTLQLAFGSGGGDDAAEEITQSVFCTVAAKLTQGEYTELGRFEPWLFRVAMNRVRDEIRRRRRHADTADPESLEALANDGRQNNRVSEGASDREGGGGEDNDQLDSLRVALSQLGDADRDVIELRHHAGMSFQQIADVLEEPVGTLLARHHRALKKLRDLMARPDVQTDSASGSSVGSFS